MIAFTFRRVCIVMMGAVGDAVHVLPLVTAIKRHDPATHITWVLQPGPASLVRGHRSVDDIVRFERPARYARGPARGRRAFEALRAFLAVRRQLASRPFDLVLDLQVYLKAGIVTSFTRAPLKLGFDRGRARDLNWLFTTHRIPPHAPQHVQDQYIEFLAWLGIAAEPLSWELGPWPEERAWQRGFVAPFDRPLAALAIGSSEPEKEWLPERWAELADVLHADYGLQPILVGGRSARELESERAIAARARRRPASALGSTLRELVAILDGAALIVSLDSAPLHIAVALERPVISLMGYNDPRRVGPYRAFHDLIVDAYGDHGAGDRVSPKHRRGRMRRIAVRDVVAKVERWRERYAPGAAVVGDVSVTPAAWSSAELR